MNKEKIKKKFDLALQNHQQNNLKEAEKLYSKILIKEPNHLGAINNLAIIFYTSNNYEKAKNLFRKAIKINPNHADAHYNLGSILGDEKEYQKAIPFYKEVIAINPNYTNAYYNLGLAFQELSEFKKAKECYEKLLEIDPDYTDAYNNLGVIFELANEYEKAKKLFKKKIEVDPKDFIAQANLANIYISKVDDFENSISSSYKALEIFQNNTKFINQSASLFRLKHDVQQAQYLISKDYKLEGIKEFEKIGDKILSRNENKEIENNSDQKVILKKDEINTLLPFYKSDFVYKPRKKF